MIPKILHATWPDPSVIDSSLPIIQHGLGAFRKLNPDWQIEISDDNDVNHYLQHNLSVQDWQNLAMRPLVEKTDLWRLLKMYHQGGVYLDIDRLCDTAMSDWLMPQTRMILPINGYWDFSQDFMGTEPGNPAFRAVIELNCQRRAQGHDQIIFLGPQTYFHALTREFFGTIIEINPGKHVMDQISLALCSLPWLQVCHEEPPLKTALYRHNGFIDDYRESKRQLYQHYNVKHWEEL